MRERTLTKGVEALGDAALKAGCRFFCGYPITPQTALLEYMAVRMPQAGGVFIQSESELAAINMVYGASAAGVRAMTASSSPGISLMQEGLSYLASAELPAVVVNVMRGGPGLGRICPSQADYFQSCKGGGHGDYHLLVLAPSSVQEMADLATLAFDLADNYRNPVMILCDGVLGEMMEPVVLPRSSWTAKEKPWAVTGAKGRPKNTVISAPYTDDGLLDVNLRLQEKYRHICQAEIRHEAFLLEDAEYIVVAFGIAARLAQAAVEACRRSGMRAGLIRPITLWPFPSEVLHGASRQAKGFLVVELNEGQMVEDVRRAVGNDTPVEFLGHGGGYMPTEEAIAESLVRVAGRCAR
jgi:2-oxoglutarate ferredoxin oxidoreductase subunit alpha